MPTYRLTKTETLSCEESADNEQDAIDAAHEDGDWQRDDYECDCKVEELPEESIPDEDARLHAN